MKPAIRTRHAQGMSLVELLVAMALGALLMGLLSSALSNVQSAWRRAEASAFAADEALAGAQRILASLASALPPDPADQHTWFRGSRERLEFLSMPPQAEAFRGPLRIRLYSKVQPNGRAALMAEIDALRESHAAPSSDPAEVRLVLGDLESLTFRFSGLHGDQPQQQDSWNDPASLPGLVHIDLSFAGKKSKPLRLAIAPRRNVSGRCRFDHVSLSCKA